MAPCSPALIRLRPVLVPRPYRHSSSRCCRVARSMLSKAVRAAEGVAEADAQVGLLEHVEQAGHRPPGRQVRLEGEEVLRLGLGLQLGQRDPAAGLGQDLHVRVLRQGAIEVRQGLRHLLPHLGDKCVGILGELQRGIVGGPLRVEVGGQVLVGVAVAVGAPDPDLLAAQPLAQRLQDADLVGDPVDACVAVLVPVQDGVLPGAAHHALQGDVLVGRVGVQLAVGILLHQRQGAEDRPVRLVVGAEVQGVQQARHHAAVVGAVGVADDRLHVLAVGRAGGLPFLDQVAQRLLVDDREDHLLDDAVGPGEGGLGQLEQQAVLAGDALQVLQEFALDAPLGPGADAVDRVQEQVHQGVRELALAQMPEDGQQRQP